MSTHSHPASTGPEPAFPAGAPYQAVALASPRAPTARQNVPVARLTPPRRAVPTSVLEGDRLLRLLAAVRSVVVVHVAHAAAALAAHEAWHLHCFRTRTDFARERLHRDPRWLADMVRLHEALERFPRLLSALCGDDGGRPLGQVAVQQLARVATPEDVDTWIERWLQRRLSTVPGTRRLRGNNCP